MSSRRLYFPVVVSLLLGAVYTSVARAQTQAELDQRGTVVIKDLSVPASNLLSPEAQAYMIHLLVDKPYAAGADLVGIDAQRSFQDKLLNQFLEPMLKRYPVTIEHRVMAGVATEVVTPKGGVPSEHLGEVLINLHGGGFTTGARLAGLVESVPVASLGRIKVITVDYRMFPEAQFPAASEDVSAVYQEVLKRYPARRIGLYGCSAGGMLSGMSIAWFDAHHLPSPAAVGVLCAGLGKMFVGDAAVLAGPLNGVSTAGRLPAKAPARMSNEFGYLNNADASDPLVYPLVSPALLAKFPPTLFVTSTRGFEFGSALNSANALTRAGVEAELHVWDGLPHAFWYNSDLPESTEVYRVIVKFFKRYLGQSAPADTANAIPKAN